MTALKIGTLDLPAEAMKHHWAVLGITGSGKSYAVRGLVEQLLDRGDRVCIIDPKGDWSGLKSSADGKSAGYPVIIFGGDHADVPIDGHSGAAIGELVATGNRPCIIDLMHFSNADKARFAAAFMGELFRKNKGRLTLVLEEAHEFAPQRPMGEETMLLHWTNKLLSQGRSRGVQVIMASQRPAKVHKDSLTQAQVLIAMRSIAVQDRDATKAWVDGVGDKDAARKVLDSLARLEVGTGWLYAPGSNILEMVKFPRIKTFDSGATPDGHDVRIPTGWATVDLSDLSAKLASVKVEAESNDPKVLKKRIAELEAKVGKAGSDDEIQKDRRRAYQTGFDEGAAEGRLQGRIAERSAIAAMIEARKYDDPTGDHTAPAPALQAGRSSGAESNFRPENDSLESASGRDRGLNTRAAGNLSPGRGNRAATVPAQDLSEPQNRCMAAFAWFKAIGIHQPTKEQICFWCGWRPTGGHIKNILGSLRSRGYLEGMRLTTNWPCPDIGTIAQFHDQIRKILDGPQIQVFNLLLANRKKTWSKDSVCEELGWSATGGHVKNVIGGMRSLGIIEKGGWSLTSMVFPEIPRT